MESRSNNSNIRNDKDQLSHAAAQCVVSPLNKDNDCSYCMIQKQNTSFLHQLSDHYNGLDCQAKTNNIPSIGNDFSTVETPHSLDLSRNLPFGTKLSTTTSSTHNLYIHKLADAMVSQRNALTMYIQEYKDKHPAHNWKSSSGNNKSNNNNHVDEQLIFIQINDLKHNRSYDFFLPRNFNVADIIHHLITSADTDTGFDLTFLPFAPFCIQLLLSTPNIYTNCTIDDTKRFPKGQPLLPHWILYDLFQHDPQHDEVTRIAAWNGEESAGQQKGQYTLPFAQRIASRPLEFDIDWRDVDMFHASQAYDVLIKPLLSKKRNFYQIFVQHMLYNKQDNDDSYDSADLHQHQHNQYTNDKVGLLDDIIQFNNNLSPSQTLVTLQSSSTNQQQQQQQQQHAESSSSETWGTIITNNTLQQHFTNYTQHIIQIDHIKVFVLQSILTGYQLILNTLQKISPLDSNLLIVPSGIRKTPPNCDNDTPTTTNNNNNNNAVNKRHKSNKE